MVKRSRITGLKWNTIYWKSVYQISCNMNIIRLGYNYENYPIIIPFLFPKSMTNTLDGAFGWILVTSHLLNHNNKRASKTSNLKFIKKAIKYRLVSCKNLNQAHLRHISLPTFRTSDIVRSGTRTIWWKRFSIHLIIIVFITIYRWKI